MSKPWDNESTPLTDAAAHKHEPHSEPQWYEMVDADFARQLECRAIAAEKRADEADAKVMQMVDREVVLMQQFGELRSSNQHPIDFAPFAPPFYANNALIYDGKDRMVCALGCTHLKQAEQIAAALNRAAGV